MQRKKTRQGLAFVFELLREGRMREGAELLYHEHYNKVYSIAFSILRDEGKSEDVVHNVTSIILSLKVENAPTRGELSWLSTVTKNEALRYLNDSPAAASLDEVAPIACEDKEIRDFVDMDAYYNMIKGLDERRQQIVTLRVLGGYTHREIALMLGKPIGTVQWLYNTAIQQLRISLAAMLTFVLLVGAVFIERLVYYVNEFIVKSTPQSPLEELPSIINKNAIYAAERLYQWDMVLLLGCLLALVIGAFIVILRRYDRRTAQGVTKGIDISVLIFAMLITCCTTAIVALNVSYNENKPLPVALHLTEIKAFINSADGESMEDIDTSVGNDFELAVGEEYSMTCSVYSYQRPSYYAPISGSVPASAVTFAYDEDLIEIRLSESGELAYVKALQPFEYTAFTFYCEEFDLSGCISISAINN